MVAVTVVAFGVLALGVLTVADGASDDPEVSSFDVETSGDFETATEPAVVRFTMTAGRSIPAQDLQVLIDGQPIEETAATVSYPNGSVEAGDEIVVEQSVLRVPAPPDRVTLTEVTTEGTALLKERTLAGDPVVALSPFLVFTAYQAGSSPGDPWNPDTDPNTASPYAVEVRDTTADVGNRSLFLQSSSTVYSRTGRVSSVSAGIDLDLSGVETVRFRATGGANDLAVQVDGTTALSRGSLSTYSDWRTATVDVSGVSGVGTFTFDYAEQTSRSTSTVYLDDVRFFDAAGDEVPPSDVLP